jgi:hypothetical protein
MRRLVSGLAVAAVVLGLHVMPARAQGNTSMFNCAMLTGSPYLCLKNEGNAPIVAVQAVAPGFGYFNPTAWIQIPGGAIPQGGAAVIRFPTFTHGPVQNIVVRTADGNAHYMWNVDVVHITSVTIKW